MAVRRALEILRERGLIRTLHGRGSVVIAMPWRPCRRQAPAPRDVRAQEAAMEAALATASTSEMPEASLALSSERTAISMR